MNVGGHRTDDKEMALFLSSELESHTCPICYDFMMPPDQAPMLLFPCGHTFCKKCLQTHLRLNKKSCPSCRGTIKSQCVNVSLQQIILSLAAKRTELMSSSSQSERKGAQATGSTGLANALTGQHAAEVDKYYRQYRMYKTRCNVLRNSARDLRESLEEATEQAKTAQLVMEHFDQAETELVSRIKSLQAELNLLQQHKHNQQEKHDRIVANRQALVSKLGLVTSTLEPLEADMEKSRLMLEHFAPDLELPQDTFEETC